jgi:hypothetical protein
VIVGVGERMVLLLGEGIIALALLNAGLMLRKRWLSYFGVAGMLAFLVLLVRGVVGVLP